EGPDGLHGYLEYSADLFDATTIKRLLGHYRNLLEGIVAAPDARLSQLPLLSKAEQSQLLVEWNDTRADYSNNLCLHELIEAQAQRTPDAVAVTLAGQELTYHELDRRANQLAHHLQKLGVGSDSLVGLCVERSMEMVIGLLGILKAGGAYVPLDPAYPKERLELMISDAGLDVLLSQADLTAGLPNRGGSWICLDSDWDRIARESDEKPVTTVAAENLAYVIYTSGSTGRPKGVLIQHGSIVNIISSFIENYRPDGSDKMLQQTSISFDVSVVEICAILAAGGTLVLLNSSEILDLDELIAFIVRTEVTMISAAPSLLARLNSTENTLPKLRLILSGGEALALSDVDNLLRSRTVINGYGPTEATVCTSCYNLSASPPRPGASIPIGKPLANYEVYVLGENLGCMQIGCPGELFIGGAGLARGYLNDPELTSLKFLPNPFRPGERMYRTGDLVRWLADGNLEFAGRLDRQVKIRGFRIELGEIEAVLSQHPGIQEGAVVAQDYGSKETRLVGYFVPDRKRAFPVCQMVRLEREGLLRGLPKYELPNGMVIVHQNKGETDFIYREIFEQQVLLRHGITLNDGDCIFDIGANIGLFTLFVGQMCKGPVIYAFEPIPPIFEMLKINAALYGLDVKLFECGLASQSRRETFTYFPQVSAMSGHFTQGSDMEAREKEVRAALDDYIGRIASADGFKVPRAAMGEELSVKNLAIEHFTCQLKTLSDVIRENTIERIDLLKVDVEKSELDVLAGIHEDDWPKIRQIVVEVHDPEEPLEQITALLRSRGYEVGVAQEALFKDTHILTTDVYAVRPDRIISSGPVAKPLAELTPTWTSPERLVSDVQLYLKEKLPAYMVPSALIVLESMPLTPNGKIDSATLPKPDQVRSEMDENHVAPRSVAEAAVAEIWKKVLGIERVGVHDSFFELGGHSLLAMQIVSRVGDAFQVELPLRALFEAPTVAEFALLLSQYPAEKAPRQG
ncbi:MAG: amino acid adenylation domain-containing protein, partial [Verrucomicrobiota bacterium]